MKQPIACVLTICLYFSLCFSTKAQESVFTGLKSNLKKANEYYQNQAYDIAAILFERELEKKPDDKALMLKLADSHFHSNNMLDAVQWYNEYENRGGMLTLEEELQFANALHSSGLYDDAISRLQNWQKSHPENDEFLKNIWQLQNIHFLMEDSIYYDISNLSSNTEYDEGNPALYQGNLVFISNRETVSIIKRKDASTGKFYFNWYITGINDPESELTDESSVGKTKQFAPEIKSKYHKAGMSFKESGDEMVYTIVTGDRKSGRITSKLFFATKTGEKWVETSPFPFNNDNYSNSYPAFSANGKRIYFSSDMPGGYGEMDLYYSDFIDNAWTKPINMGEEINTSRNEGHPFIFGTTLYFSSDGHPGLGGLDIFHVDLSEYPLKIINHGYPVNTYHDDFDLILDSAGTSGYFCSNRDKQLNKGDDIYRIVYKKLSFPLTINGNISMKKYDLKDNHTILEKLPNANIALIDRETQKTVYASMTNAAGKFNIEIPYESKYLLKVKQQKLGTAIVSMEIPSSNQNFLNHDIVIVQELFNNSEEPSAIIDQTEQPY